MAGENSLQEGDQIYFPRKVGGFIEVHVATPLLVCETRDRKGLYKKARQGLVQQFTGVSDPYELPEAPEIKLDTTNITPQQVIEDLMQNIRALGYVQ